MQSTFTRIPGTPVYRAVRKTGQELTPGAGGRAAAPVWKRALDLTAVLAALLPWVLLSLPVALWIRAVSRGPVLFRQTRVGLGERRFTIFKFRTMKSGAERLTHERHIQALVENNAPLVKLDALGDPRLIPGGRLLRAAGLDELPQLWNVLRGEMSLVGPRPCLPQEHALFNAAQRRRFAVLPGLTGLWQVSRHHPVTFRGMNAMDVLYAKNSSLRLDLLIMLKTPLALLRQTARCLKTRSRSVP